MDRATKRPLKDHIISFSFPIGKNFDGNSNFLEGLSDSTKQRGLRFVGTSERYRYITAYGGCRSPRGPSFLGASVSFARTQRLSTFLIRCAARRIILRACGATASAASSI
ncbi:hypothetical protein PUN28_007386 [Cardiocondyla obscurior]|uniref:Uncharacterized protein n=1 Tax=Cardiocondyla obscurior TaxID=286306 RepID=A0AAW2G4P3_9HYME